MRASFTKLFHDKAQASRCKSGDTLVNSTVVRSDLGYIAIFPIMRTTEGPTLPMIMITGGRKQYQVYLDNLSEFLNHYQLLHESSGLSLEDQIRQVMELTTKGADAELRASELKNPLLFLLELDMLFKGLLHEQP